jgi:formylglycine-generating enzyme required for sulfatase activity
MDMAGNAWEWCADWYDENYYKNVPIKNPTGSEKGRERVLRGGAWNNGAVLSNIRCSGRSGNLPTAIGSLNGFRCVSLSPGP